jgi:hypothetical protein
MATFKQTLVETDDSPTGGKGHRNDSNIRASFPGSPIYDEILTDELVINQGIQALNGAQTDPIVPTEYDVGMDGTNLGEIKGTGGYYGGSNINLNYNADGGPIVSGKTEDADFNQFNSGGGTPTNEYVPALASNGTAGATEPSDLPSYDGDLSELSKLTTGTTQWGSGDGHKLDPSTSSVAISGQTIGNYTKGSSS